MQPDAVESVIRQAFLVIAEEMQAGREVAVRGFGVFGTHESPARELHTPLLKGPVALEDHRSPRVRWSRNLRKQVAG